MSATLASLAEEFAIELAALAMSGDDATLARSTTDVLLLGEQWGAHPQCMTRRPRFPSPDRALDLAAEFARECDRIIRHTGTPALENAATTALVIIERLDLRFGGFEPSFEWDDAESEAVPL